MFSRTFTVALYFDEDSARFTSFYHFANLQKRSAAFFSISENFKNYYQHGVKYALYRRKNQTSP